MTALTTFFFRTPLERPTPWAIIAWWEARRLPYNLAVGAAGILSLTTVALAELLAPGGRVPSIPWPGIVVYAALANLCYSAGPLLDLWIVRRWGAAYAPVGPALFRYGFVFAVGLTLLPVPLAAASWVLRILLWSF